MRSRRAWLVAGTVVALVLLVVLVGLSDLRQLGHRITELSLAWCAVAVVLSLLSYAAAGVAQQRLFAGLGHDLGTWTTIRAVALAMAVNRHVRSGGAAGLATLTWLLHGHGLRLGVVLIANLAALLATNTVFTCLFLAGVGATVLAAREGPLESRQLVAFALAAGAFVLGLGLAWAALTVPRARRAWSRVVVRVTAALGRRFDRPSWGPRVSAFLDRVAGTSLDLLALRGPGGRAWGWIVLRLAASLAALWACFSATDVAIPLGTLVLGYSAGKVMGVLSVVPAGLGLVEGGMVSVFVVFGIPYEVALLAALVNRVTYHVAPAAVALLVGAPLLRAARRRGPPPGDAPPPSGDAPPPSGDAATPTDETPRPA